MNKQSEEFIKRKFAKEGGDNLPSAVDILYSRGKASDALMYSELFIPELVDIEGSIFLKWKITNKLAEEKLRQQLQETNLPIDEIEASYNFIEIGYLFDVPGRDTNDDEDKLLAHLIMKSWSSWLRECYPGRKFRIEVLPSEITGSTVGVHFFEEREGYRISTLHHEK